MKATTVLLSITAIAAGCVEASAAPASLVTEHIDTRPSQSLKHFVVEPPNDTHVVVAMAAEDKDNRKSQHHNHWWHD
jgi:hypothetical protein